MLSVCCCVLNAKYDVEMFVRSLHAHNPGFDFEICLAHDDRVDDGSAAHLHELAKEFDNLRIVRRTRDDAVDYLTKSLAYYDAQQIFSDAMRKTLHENLELFAVDQLFDPQKNILWLSSGHLYNAAVGISRGDQLIVTPADFHYLFSLKRLQDEMHARTQGGYCYLKPWAAWARIGNQRPHWLVEQLTLAQQGPREGDRRWDNSLIFRDIYQTPQTLEQHFLMDFRNNRMTSLASPEFLQHAGTLLQESIDDQSFQILPKFHGFHFMTRNSYEAIGGFTEEYYGRALADDKMTALGQAHHGHHNLSREFSVAWIGCHERWDGHPSQEPDDREQFETNYSFFGRHPLYPFFPYYLHRTDDVTLEHHDHHKMTAINSRYFSHFTPPVRLL